jgi:hypothetical protein
MKKTNAPSHTLRTITTALLAVFILFSFQQCTDQVETTSRYHIMKPVYMSVEEIRSSVALTAPVEVAFPGKIYLYGQYVLVNEPGKGLHIIDNEDPANPNPISFLTIPGNYDMAVRGDVLFANSYMDLVAIDIADPTAPKEVHRLEDIFLNTFHEPFFDPEKGVVIDWELKEVLEVTQDEQHYGQMYYWHQRGFNGDLVAFSAEAASTDVLFGGPINTPTGIGGSMARFTIVNDYLYTIDVNNVQVFDIKELDQPTAGKKVLLGWGIETIFPYENKLFFGSQVGMHIYSISNPAEPTFISSFEHIRSCDPVVVEGQYAYVTLRSGNECRTGFANQLDVIDISQIKDPRLVKSYEMINPHGVGIDRGTLFVCEGSAGLKVFDATNVRAIDQNLLEHYKDIDAYDVIPYNNNLLLIGRDGLFQFDYSDPQDIKLLSVIPVTRQVASK